MGDVVIRLILEKYGVKSDTLVHPAKVLVTVFDEQTAVRSIAVAASLREAGIDTICYPEASKLPRQFKFADRNGIRYILVIGPDEIEKGTVVVKDLTNSSQETLTEA